MTDITNEENQIKNPKDEPEKVEDRMIRPAVGKEKGFAFLNIGAMLEYELELREREQSEG